MKFSGKWIWVLVLGTVVLFFFFRRSNTKPNPAAANASLNVGKTQSRNSMSSGTTSSASDNFAFSARHVLFLTNNNPHPLSQRIEALVAQGLKDFPLIEKLEIASATSTATKAPDLFLRVDSSDIKEDGVLSRTLKAAVSTSLGRAPWQSRHFVQSGSTPPLVQFTWNGTLNHESTFSGVRTDRYKDSARDIADQLLKGITNQLKELSTKYPAMPELPREFYGPYQPVGDFPFLKEMNAQRICSYHGLFTHNETFWRFQTATNPLPQLQRIAEQFKADGWKLDDSNLTTNTLDYYQRFMQEDVVVEIFHEERERMDLGAAEKKRTTLGFIVHYQKLFSDAEREAVLEKLFTINAPLETLLPFQNSFSWEQSKRYYAILEKSPANSPRSYVLLAEHHWSRRDTNAAVKMLLRAKAFQASSDSGHESRIDDLAKKISPKEKLKLELTPELYREFGFLEITNAPQTFELERAFGQPVLLFADGKRGPQTFCLTIDRPQKENYPWSMIETEGQGRSKTSSGFNLPARGEWQQKFIYGDRSLHFTATLLPDGKGFKHRVETK